VKTDEGMHTIWYVNKNTNTNVWVWG